MTPVQHLVRRLLPAVLALPFVGIFTGCGTGTVTAVAPGTLNVTGRVHGGVQPVSGATVELFSVGTDGNGSQATDILQHPVITAADSSFNISSDYTCTSPNEQLYLVVRGGNPGLVGNVNNPALVLMSALGSCTNLVNNPGSFIFVNEVSTVAAVYALAPFMTAYDHVGATATNVSGLSNAFLNAQLLVNSSNGQAASLASNLAIEQAKLYSLADAVVPCVNSNGNACTFLFAAATPKGGTAPTDVVGALLNIVHHPGDNVAAVFNLISPTPPFAGALKKAPNDWTMSLTVTGGGLYEPTALALDHAGNVWVANFGGGATPYSKVPYSPGVVAYSPQGVPFSSTPFVPTQTSEVYGLTLDRNGDVWVTNEENISHDGTMGSITKIAGAESGAPGAYLGTFYDDTLDFPESIASDPSTGNILVANFAGNTATYYDINGNFVKNTGAYSLAFPVSIASDGSGGAWVANGSDYTVTHVAANGTALPIKCCVEPYTVSPDPDGNVWITNFIAVKGTYTISEVSSTGGVLLYNVPVAGLDTPGRGAVDAGGQFWVVNYHDSTILGIAGNHAALPPATPLSPVPLGRDANLVEPFAIVPDASGNLWVSDRGVNSLVMFFGLATPTATPVMARPTAP